MSQERKEWLTEALKQFQFDEANQMQIIMQKLKEN